MTEVQFIDIKPFVSCCKDLVVSYHVPSTIKTNARHYVALKEVCEDEIQSEFTWVWASKTLEPEKNGITVKWGKGTVMFASHVLPKLSDGSEYYFIYCNEAGTILGRSRPFQFFTDSDEFSSIDLQSTASDDVVMVSMHRKKAPSTSSSEVSLHSNGSSLSFEVLSEQRYSDITELHAVEKQKPQYFNQSVTSTVVAKGDNSTESTPSLGGKNTKSDDELLSSRTKNYYQNTPMESNNDQEAIQLLECEVSRLRGQLARSQDEVTMKDNIIEELQTEITMLKQQVAINALSNSTVLINSPKDDKEKRILKKRIQDETKKSSRLEELLHHKETKVLQLENKNTELGAELQKSVETSNQLAIEKSKMEQHLQTVTMQLQSEDFTLLKTENKKLLDQIQKLQTELYQAKQQQKGLSVESVSNRKATVEEVSDLNIPVGADYKTKLYIKLFRQDPFVCHICNEVLPAHTQEFTRLNHVQQCKGITKM